ncbi:translation initiation factor IF-3 [Candidatus Uhrbacteria bacterium]|nr:translation initiation factor IF-3 [Candidatus Uhrbacteria bacterium]
MRISRHRRTWRSKIEEPLYFANERIRAPEVRLIDEEGKNLGVISTAEALKIAGEREYDLVEVSPKAQPPIARLLDYGQFKYEKEKEARKQKAHAHKVMVKGVRLSVRIGAHDLEVRRQQALKFLREGDKAQIELILRGRERQHVDLAKGVMEDFAASLNASDMPTKIEQPFQRQGGRLTIIVARV